MFRFLVTLTLCVSCLPQVVVAQDEQSPLEMLQEGGRLVEQGEFDAAAKLFRSVIEKDEVNPQAWLMLGYSLHMDGKLDEALKTHQKTATFRQTKGIGLYNVACVYALKGDKDNAFSYLNQAVKARFADADQYEGDDDLSSLRDDIRYQRLMKRIDGEDVTDDFKAADMVGRWITVSIVRAGEKVDPKNGYSDVGKDAYVLHGSDQEQGPIPYTVDVSKLVPTITVAGEAKGILRMIGDELTICLNQSSGDAPKKFQSTAENGYRMMVFRRAVTPDRLAGKWAYMSGTRAGKEVAKERLVGEVTVTGETFTLPAGPSDKFVMKYELNSNSKMDMIDLEIKSGPVPEGKAVGIVKLEGDTMTFCYDPTGQKRPTEFKTTEDDGFFMFTLKRVVPKKSALFGGASFEGWEGNLDIFRIEDGAIVGGTLDEKIAHNEFLTTKQEFANFELRLKFMLKGDNTNAGIQIRSRRIDEPAHEMIGYQADLGQNYWGCLYDESRRRKVLAGPDKVELDKVLKRGDWNDYRIRCEGKRIQLWINGFQTVDYTEDDDSIEQTGLIGLQIHGGSPGEAWYKDIEIEVL